MISKIIAIIAGYAVFVVTSLLLFSISGQDPHQQASIGFVLLTLLYGIVFSTFSGWVVRLIAGRNSMLPNYILACIIAGFALFSLLKAGGSHWTQLLAIFVFAPASILGGPFFTRRTSQ